MYTVCGCGAGETKIDGAHEHTHVHEDGTVHSHAHDHVHDGQHTHAHGDDHHHHEHRGAHDLDYGSGPAHAHVPGLSQARMVQIEQDILAKNNGYAMANRQHFDAHGIFALNLVSSPGSGKTTLLVKTIELLKGTVAINVVEGDQQTANDAERIRATGVQAVQINTGKGCHLDGHMVGHAVQRLQPADESLFLIENVGNLVCPAAFDLGEHHKVAILSVTEGEDKPLKYPDMFAAADVMLLNKCDLLPYLEFDPDLAEANARRVNPHLTIIRVSASNGDGLSAWVRWIQSGLEAQCARRAASVDALKRRVAELERQLAEKMTPTGRLFRIYGLVQGVGFRPYVWRLANELGLTGWVRNDGAGVTAAVNGEKWPEFKSRLVLELPRLARIDAIHDEAAEVIGEGFVIVDSAAGEVKTAIGPDAAICRECIADICDPANRRWRYAFSTCTHCGPRYTVSRRIPYDRAQTSLADFPLCVPCATEYRAPGDRRFHAETTCCPDCGPQLSLRSAEGLPLPGDPIAETLRLLRDGQIVAIKGIGGFHLACDAHNAAAVAELRERKQREEKPFAIMALNAASLADYAQVGAAAQGLLQSVAAPIVLCPKGGAELKGIAPGLAWLGVMLPSTPLHLLLWHEAASRPGDTEWLDRPSELLLVMTSANPHGEPLAIANDEAHQRLAGIADAYLQHDRDIVIRCDDAVVRAGPVVIRRARGYVPVPVPVPLPDDGPTVLALGGYLKNTICVMKGREAFLSQHIGSLDNRAAIGFLDETVAHLLSILDVRPDVIAHDLHPDFPSTQLAVRLAEKLQVPAIAVGHHHAHIASICAEHGLIEPVHGLALDGVGLGPDGAAWGGELLFLEGERCQRLGHLSPLAMPGGDRAAKEPWRMAVSALHGAGLGYRVGGWIKQYYPTRDPGPLLTMLARKLRCPLSTSLGRWFDAAAGLLGVRDLMHFEGQAAMELEGLAAQHGPVDALPGGYVLLENNAVLDFSPMLNALMGCKDDAAHGAALFHATVAAGLAAWVQAAVDRKKGAKIAIGGGCAQNAILMAALRHHLAAAQIDLIEARQVPANDGGLALGQAWVARRNWLAGLPLSGENSMDQLVTKEMR